jgi:threonine synthase
VSIIGSYLACAGCGWRPADDDPAPFRCPNAGTDDGDHVVARTLDPFAVRWPEGAEPNPFVRYRGLLHSYHLALANGMIDSDYVDLVERLDKKVAAVDGRGFVATPFGRSESLSRALGFDAGGGVWLKDETGNVSGSHKARHLFGLLLHLRVADETGISAEPRAELAIASCGNAALAAAVVAKAADRPLRVFVPTSADPVVVNRLVSLGALIEEQPRKPGVSGDPTYHALRRAIDSGAVPFTCQGNEDGLAIEGGHTLGYEMVSDLRGSHTTLDRLFIQVGGGALASAVIAAFTEAFELGVVKRLPRFQTVQTEGGFPLKRAYDLLTDRALTRIEDDTGETPDVPGDDRHRADFLCERARTQAVQDELAYAARHRHEFMWPWEEEPKSVANGILDDETYDWLAVVRGMVATGGFPVVVDEASLEEANELARGRTNVEVDHTGTAGLAGLMNLTRRGDVRPDERVAVLFTGARREP